jgi:hypothetical protein
MKLRSLVIALLIAAASATVHAQGAIYINPIAVHVTNSTADNSLFAFLGKGKTSAMFYGVAIGGFYDIPTQHKEVEIGLDVRDEILHGNNALLNSFLVGPRISPTKYGRFHPYIEPFVGAGSTRAPNTAIRITKTQFGVFAGLDYDINRHVDFRVAEISYSSLSTASAGTIGLTQTIPSSNLFSITSGLTFRLP